MRSIAEQTDDELGGPLSVLVRQKQDHAKLDRLLSDLPAAPGEDQDEVLNRINRLVFSHAFAEEAVLWPVMRRKLPDGEQLTLRVEKEHQEVNELVVALEEGGPRAADREALVDRLIEVLREDVRDEEDLLLPRLQEVCSIQELRRLGAFWEAVRRTAPTRPHPVIARRPPGNVLSALPLSAVDRSRDLVDFAARRAASPNAAARLRLASVMLARAAGRIEHIGPMHRGENPRTRHPDADE